MGFVSAFGTEDNGNESYLRIVSPNEIRTRFKRTRAALTHIAFDTSDVQTSRTPSQLTAEPNENVGVFNPLYSPSRTRLSLRTRVRVSTKVNADKKKKIGWRT